jgi:hypothetical protein
MMQAARTSKTSVNNYFTRQYIPEDKSELHIRRRENLKSHTALALAECRPTPEERQKKSRKEIRKKPLTINQEKLREISLRIAGFRSENRTRIFR